MELIKFEQFLIMKSICFQVHINLGAGESEVSSPLNLKLNDLAWHTVKLTRKEAEMELVLDGHHSSRYQESSTLSTEISILI